MGRSCCCWLIFWCSCVLELCEACELDECVAVTDVGVLLLVIDILAVHLFCFISVRCCCSRIFGPCFCPPFVGAGCLLSCRIVGYFATLSDLLFLPEVMCCFFIQFYCWRRYRIGGCLLENPCCLNGLRVLQPNRMLGVLGSNGSTATAGGIGGLLAVAFSWCCIAGCLDHRFSPRCELLVLVAFLLFALVEGGATGW
ncbi:hypothetical protein Nepgr_015818 [Nepenthes gracilis]|uniref:Uncharacterized protein n=1 Tax=Nepenthes gracilis TaxID=150966 RepID=A0AAD3XQP9_NEPGR|nr:hypothetical protein Nepgr_015818 [Nepenthes gracilis]